MALSLHQIKWWCLSRLVPEGLYLRLVFRRLTGQTLHLRHPRTLNEKLQWLKLHDRKPQYTQLADKYLAREYLRQKVGDAYLVPLLKVYDHPDEITLENLPDSPFIIKNNHDSGMGVVVRSKPAMDLEAARKKLLASYRNNHYWLTKEWPYKNIAKRIVVERLLQTRGGWIPNDYKFNCFSGKVHFIYVSIDREGRNYRKIYSPQWQPLNMTWTARGKEKTKFDGPEIAPPDGLAHMVALAETLARDFDYIRIDMYNVDGKIYCGEITQFHGSGFEPILPAKLNEYYGSLIRNPPSPSQ